MVCTPPPPPPSKRKHFDEEAQFYADDEDCWKRPRTWASSLSPSTGDNDDDAEMTMDGIDDNGDPTAAEVSSTRTEGSGSPDEANHSLHEYDDATTTMEIEIECYSPASPTTTANTATPPTTTTISITANSHIYPTATASSAASRNELSWNMQMQDLKALRQQSPQAALQRSSEARREVMRFLWRNTPSSRNSTVINR